MKRTIAALIAAAAVTGAAQAEVLRMAYSTAPRSIDPYPFGGATTASLKEHVFEALVGHDDQPLLATGWNWNSPTSLTVNLRDGVTFHNGEPLTARDVVYSACRMMFKVNDKRNLLTSSMGPLADVVADGPLAVRFEMKNPYPLWIQMMKFLSILSASGGDVPDGPIKYDASGDCGIAAYPTRIAVLKVVSWTKEKAVMTRNDAYWGDAAIWDGLEISAVTNSGARMAGRWKPMTTRLTGSSRTRWLRPWPICRAYRSITPIRYGRTGRICRSMAARMNAPAPGWSATNKRQTPRARLAESTPTHPRQRTQEC